MSAMNAATSARCGSNACAAAAPARTAATAPLRGNEREQVRGHLALTIQCHVETSFRREWMDMRIPKPAIRVTNDVPP